MTAPTACTRADAMRLGNLVVSAWAAAPAAELAQAWLDTVLGRLLADDAPLYLLGHRPGVVDRLPRPALPADLQRLLAALADAPEAGPLHRVPSQAGADVPALIRPGDLHLRRTVIDDSTGLGRIASTHLGRLLFIVPAAAALRAIQSAPVLPPVQRSVSSLVNAWAGLRQPDARWLRAIRAWPDDRVVITWQGKALCLLAGEAQVGELHQALAGAAP
ncbi:MAG: hypothetical protein EKK53_00500 [Burkholderiales bacterium]|nr:MAG: hypothetical protein EKK53_00500 [Burkholderiales bacterium]